MVVTPTEATCPCGTAGTFIAQPVTLPAPGAKCQSCKSSGYNTAIGQLPSPTMVLVPQLANQSTVSNYQSTPVFSSGPSLGSLPESLPSNPAMYAHSSDYSNLTGKLYYSPRTKTWLLRYIPVEEEDHFGGVMTLVGLDPNDRNLKAGITVTVRGRIADPNTTELSPAFLLQEIRVVGD